MPQEIALSAEARELLIDRLLVRLRECYVFPEVAEQIVKTIRARHGFGSYDSFDSGEAIAQALTADLQEVSRDRHLRVIHSSESRDAGRADEPTPEERATHHATMALWNFGFEKVERLAGNVGYLDLRLFADPIAGGNTAVAAMNFLAHCGSLIIDLQNCIGGDPTMIALISSYLFAEPVHLNDLYWREGNSTQQFWTVPYVPGLKHIDKPVFVLTSRRSFSAAEEFANNLKVLDRATIVGERTGGGAHPTRGVWLTDNFVVNIPMGRAINPVSGTNWEGVGVAPDIEVSETQAFSTAYRAALEKFIETLPESPSSHLRGLIEEATEALARIALT